MLPRLLALVCLSVAALVGLKLAGASLAWWPAWPSESSIGLIVAAWVGGAWLLVARLASQPAASAAAPAAPDQAAGGAAREEPRPARSRAARLARLERRAHPRFAVDWPVRADWHDGTVTEGRLHDISHGGACVAAAHPVAAGTKGLVTVQGILLPVPARVVGWTAATGLHVSFELQGLGLETFLFQLHRQLDLADTASRG